MSKNNVIFILVVLLVISGIWGSLADRKRIALKEQLNETTEQMQKVSEQSDKQRDQVLKKTADLQQTLADREEQLAKARKELITLRKEIKSIEAKLSGCSATVDKLGRRKEELAKKVRTLQGNDTTDKGERAAGSGGPDTDLGGSADNRNADSGGQVDETALREKLATTTLANARLQQKLDAAAAQLTGLGKLLEAKTSALEETSQEMDRLQINMDVLLAKIADQKDELQEVRANNRKLVQELADKNGEIADLQDKLLQQPVRE